MDTTRLVFIPIHTGNVLRAESRPGCLYMLPPAGGARLNKCSRNHLTENRPTTTGCLSGWCVTTVTFDSSYTLRTHSEMGATTWTNRSRWARPLSGVSVDQSGFGLHRYRTILRFRCQKNNKKKTGRMFLHLWVLVAPGLHSRDKQLWRLDRKAGVWIQVFFLFQPFLMFYSYL